MCEAMGKQKGKTREEMFEVEMRSLKLLLRERDRTIVDLEKRLGLSRDSLEKPILGLKKEINKNIALENEVVALRDILKEADMLLIENKKLKIGVALFSKTIQTIGLELVKVSVNLSSFLMENRNDGQKTGRKNPT